MVNLDVILTILIGIFCFVSAILAADSRNKYSRQVKLLKILPRIFLGLQFLLIPVLYDDVVLTLTEHFSVSSEIRVILWGVLMLFCTESLIQFLNIKYGRAEIK